MSTRVRDALLVTLLLAVTAVWGWTFLIVKEAVRGYPVLSFLALRFVVAALVLAPFAVTRWSRRTVAVGIVIGLVMAAGYFFQTAGLTGTSAANAGLLTGLFVIFTPVFDRVFYRTPVTPVTVAAIGAGFAGTGLLTLAGHHGITWADGFEVLTAVAFAVQLVWLGHYTKGHSSQQLAFGQMAPAAVGFLFLAGVTGGADAFPWPSPSVWFAIILTGVVASALGFWAQTFVQQRMSPSRTALVLLSEPAFATLFAVWLGGERLTMVQWVGAVLIFLSLVAHEGFVAWRMMPPGVSEATVQ